MRCKGAFGVSGTRLSKRIIGCNIISSLIQEYSNTVKSSDVGLPWETHFKAKKQFEVTDLKRIFQFCVQALSEMTKDDVSLTVEMLNLLKHLALKPGYGHMRDFIRSQAAEMRFLRGIENTRWMEDIETKGVDCRQVSEGEVWRDQQEWNKRRELETGG
uniref:Uncharacterized protein n=1 Tax=Timema cristinae TaxID=61476 RepID=A0A7R9GTQ9_TIMCR|nr:unnamed protein product [Timema cristinae]